MTSLVLLLLGALSIQEPYRAPPDPQNLWRVTFYDPFMFSGSDTPFKREQAFLPKEQVPDPETLRRIAAAEDRIIEVCRPSQTGAAGQWLWPGHSVRERRQQCDVYGTPREQQP